MWLQNVTLSDRTCKISFLNNINQYHDLFWIYIILHFKIKESYSLFLHNE